MAEDEDNLSEENNTDLEDNDEIEESTVFHRVLKNAPVNRRTSVASARRFSLAPIKIYSDGTVLNNDFDTPLHLAVRNKRYDELRRLLKQKLVNVNEPGWKGETGTCENAERIIRKTVHRKYHQNL